MASLQRLYQPGGHNPMSEENSIIPSRCIESKILLIRGKKVMIDADLAELYGTTTGRLNEQVRRNRKRFPPDFMFQLDNKEDAALISQFAISKTRGGRRHNPYAFTEQGVAMLSSVLHSERAIAVNIEIMRAFVKLHRLLASNEQLARQLSALEQKYDTQFKVVFDAIRELMTPPEPKRRSIGFTANRRKKK